MFTYSNQSRSALVEDASWSAALGEPMGLGLARRTGFSDRRRRRLSAFRCARRQPRSVWTVPDAGLIRSALIDRLYASSSGGF